MRRLLPDVPELGWTPYLWLLYLGFLFVVPMLNGAPLRDWFLYAAVAVTFVPLYLRAFWLRGWKLMGRIALFTAIGAVLIPFNAGASVFFIYGTSFLGFASRPPAAYGWLGIVLAVLGLESWWLQLHPGGWIPAAVFSTLIGLSNIQFAEARRHRHRLEGAQQELAKLAERERIARDLHDLLGHTLSLITLKAELAAKLATRDPSGAAVEIREVERISRQALSEVRRAVRGFRSQGLEAELAKARLALETAGVRLEHDVADDLSLTEAQEAAVLLALREAVTNVIRHADAGHCWIRLGRNGRGAVLEVRDDGRGSSAPEGTGLAAMRERAEALGGRVERHSRGGTLVRLTLPLSAGSTSEERVVL